MPAQIALPARTPDMEGALFSGFTNEASTDIRVSVNGGTSIEVNSVEIILGGDTECETFIQALEHAIKIIKLQME
jgi:hypothetical protein